MNFLLFGAPGTGKGTQSSFLISHFNLCHISTGELFRKAWINKTELGVKAKQYMDLGQLVPDSIVIDLIEEVLSQSCNFSIKNSDYKGFILDGFPRNLIQAKSLESLLTKWNIKLDIVFYLNVLKPVLFERIVGRRVAPKSACVYHTKFKPPLEEGICDQSGEALIQRKDDTPQVVTQRLKSYYEQTTVLIDFYQKKNILVEIDGSGTPEQVFSHILSYIPK